MSASPSVQDFESITPSAIKAMQPVVNNDDDMDIDEDHANQNTPNDEMAIDDRDSTDGNSRQRLRTNSLFFATYPWFTAIAVYGDNLADPMGESKEYGLVR
jgi:hypothetical protein